MEHNENPNKTKISELKRQLAFRRTMFGRLQEKNRKAEKAYEAKLLRLQLEIATLEAEGITPEPKAKGPHYEATVNLTGGGNIE